MRTYVTVLGLPDSSRKAGFFSQLATRALRNCIVAGVINNTTKRPKLRERAYINRGIGCCGFQMKALRAVGVWARSFIAFSVASCIQIQARSNLEQLPR